jgi:hypothetical protein
MKEIIFDLLCVGRQAKIGLTPEVSLLLTTNLIQLTIDSHTKDSSQVLRWPDIYLPMATGYTDPFTITVQPFIQPN